ncbi:MAG: YtpI family protein [Firmicutes bacterium]|uniref:YtpI-like protein n=1 Tax=Melghirimyces thermohalophilus TaxID=1236220 RepID=A0A1G6MLM9_9BACL|nr:YtpI family protein [Melghirimyces thermohalophilus]MDA8354077.1 YtpI family protein [Bacillota bacterium]SDC55845.1 YtpI-like protein [Melghirimyces thermohalophilus]
MQLFMVFLIIVVVVTAIRTFSNSIAGRRADGLDQLKHRAQMNINMGLMFIAVALMQGISLGDWWIRLLMIAVGALGIYNLIFGLRARNFYRKKLEEQQ